MSSVWQQAQTLWCGGSQEGSEAILCPGLPVWIGGSPSKVFGTQRMGGGALRVGLFQNLDNEAQCRFCWLWAWWLLPGRLVLPAPGQASPLGPVGSGGLGKSEKRRLGRAADLGRARLWAGGLLGLGL